jgi:hypothetical protein
VSATAPFPWLRHYAFAVGAMDTVTGILLIAAPALTLRLMLIARQPSETIWLRFVGAFVTGIGLTYLYALAATRGRGGILLAAVLEFTAIVRGAVGLVVGASVARGALPAAWLTVAVTDLALAIVQAVLVRQGAGVVRARS